MTEERNLPERHVEICRAFAAVAKKYGLDNCTVRYRPGFGDEWRNDVTVAWEQGRHGADVEKLFIESTVRVWARLPPPAPATALRPASDQGG